MSRRWLALSLLLLACSSGGATEGSSPVDTLADAAAAVDVEVAPGVRLVHRDGQLSGEAFFDAPWPSDRRGAGAVVHFPNPDGSALVQQLVAIAASEGFPRTGSVSFRFTGPIQAPPAAPETMAPTSSVQLVDIDPASPERGRRFPVDAHFRGTRGPYWPSNLLTLTPVQGIALRPRTRYAALVRWELVGGTGAYAVSADDASALEAVDVPAHSVAALTTFTTGHSGEKLETFVAAARAHAAKVSVVPVLTREYPSYCVFEGMLDLPDYQEGEPPYAESGGAWPAAPVTPRRVGSRMVITVPRGQGETLPAVVFVRTGGGGDVPLVDRGVHEVAHGEAEPGSGPAQELAAIGFMGISIDGPHGGVRNVTKGDEQFLVFNVLNPAALRDNIRQSALELALLPDLLATFQLDSSACSGAAGVSRADLGRLALAGHSMGATIAPLVLAVEPRYQAAVLSGAGSSLSANVLYKKSPLEVRPLMEAALGHAARGIRLEPGDPVLGLIQWGGEVSDPPAYGDDVTAHVLMVQGIVDTYILPPISNPTVLALGLDLGGQALDAPLVEYPSVVELLQLVGRAPLALPVSGNRAGRTAVVVHHAEDGIEDGHEVFFQLEAPKAQYRRFLETFAAGGEPPVVP